MTTKEINDIIQNTPASEQFLPHILGIIQMVNTEVGKLEHRISKIEERTLVAQALPTMLKARKFIKK